LFISEFLWFNRIGPAGFQLLIIQADPSQAGIYTCLAYSKAGEAKQQFRLTVLGINIQLLIHFLIFVFPLVPPRIQRENTSILVISPKPVELPCQITQGHPAPLVK
jgi:hypothetical protein